jgi:peptide-methionine (S)-S-oxide reductase
LIEGVTRTRVGYTGGAKKNPTYHSLGDHTEAVQIDYDPSLLTYGKLLKIFFDNHEPFVRSRTRQYMPAVFYHTEEQRMQILEEKKRREEGAGKKVLTEILAAGEFYLAESYHQKYYLRGARTLMKEIQTRYPSEPDLIASTVAARINGYLGSHGKIGDLEKEIDHFGLSQEARRELIGIVRSLNR